MATNTQTPPAAAADQQQGIAARLGSKIRKWKDLAKQAQDERDKLKADLDAAQTQIKDLSGRADGNEAARQRDELAAKLREITHKQVFNEAAKKAGAMTETQLNDLWQLSGYKPEGETPDAAAIDKLIGEQKQQRAYLFGQAGQQSQQQSGSLVPDRPNSPGPAAGRGGAATDQGLFVITRAQANDPLFMRDNAAKIWQAQKEGRFQLADNQPSR